MMYRKIEQEFFTELAAFSELNFKFSYKFVQEIRARKVKILICKAPINNKFDEQIVAIDPHGNEEVIRNSYFDKESNWRSDNPKLVSKIFEEIKKKFKDDEVYIRDVNFSIFDNLGRSFVFITYAREKWLD